MMGIPLAEVLFIDEVFRLRFSILASLLYRRISRTSVAPIQCSLFRSFSLVE